jgi:hypothetical protein
MQTSPQGLTNMTTEELKKLLRLIYNNEVTFPLNIQRITCIGFQYKHSVLMKALRDLDESAARAVIVCVLAERLQR